MSDFELTPDTAGAQTTGPGTPYMAGAQVMEPGTPDTAGAQVMEPGTPDMAGAQVMEPGMPVASTQGGLPPDITRESFLRMGYRQRAELKALRPGVYDVMVQNTGFF